jgi:hypothetical protein
MKFVRIVLFLVPIAGWASCLGSVAFCQTANVTVVVVGTGPSIDEAKTDAVRKALQSTVKQLVVVDRVISQNEILRDKVLSTMNGYIEAFNQKAVARTSTGYSVTAAITVSSSRIENYVGINMGGGGQIDGGSLLAEQNRRLGQVRADQAQAQAQGEIFDRLLRGFPAAAVDVKIVRITLADNDPNTIWLDYEYRFKPTFVKALLGTLKTLSVMECRPPAQLEDWAVFTFANGARYPDYCSTGQSPGSLASFSGNAPNNGICLRLSTNTLRCFALPPGTYCASCDLEDFGNFSQSTITNKQFVFLGKFLNITGQSANKEGVQCFLLAGNSQLRQYFISRLVSAKNGFFGSLDLREGTGRLTVAASLVALDRAKYFVALAGLALPNQNWGGDLRANRWLTNLVAGEGNPVRADCSALDGLAQLQTLAQQPEASNGRGGQPTTGAKSVDESNSVTRSYWRTEGGSVLLLKESENSVEVRYVKVAPSVTGTYASPGDIVFQGKRSSNQAYGSATSYAEQGCRVTYSMQISFEDDDRMIVTNGAPPANISRPSCTAMGSGGSVSARWQRVQ